jgi:transcriptional regulator
MYIPEHFRARDSAATVSFVRANPFAILVSNNEDEPFATHLPLVVREQGGNQLLIRGHFAKANPHWRYLEKQPSCMMIFHGPHAYISPALYANRESVPTWNYGAVHIYGNARLFSSPDSMLSVLHDLIQTFEPAYAQQWTSLDETYRERMLRQIVGFEITATKIEAKFKLSQNRTQEDQANVIESLGQSADSVVSGVAHLMQEQGLGCPHGKDKK